MSTLVLPQELHGVPLLAGLDDGELATFISHCEATHCPSERIVISQGDEDRALYFILDGSAEVVIDVPHVGEEVVATLAPKSTFGEASFFHPAPHCATVRCTEAVRLLRLRYEKYEQLKFENDRIALRIGSNAASVLAARLQETDVWFGEHLTQLQDRRMHESWLRFRQRVGHSSVMPSGGFHVG